MQSYPAQWKYNYVNISGYYIPYQGSSSKIYLVRLGGKLEVGALHYGIHGASLLTEAAVYALRHVDVIAGGASAAVLTLLGLNCDGLCGTHCLAQLAGDAALLARGVAPQHVLTAEAGTDRALLEGVVDLNVHTVRKLWIHEEVQGFQFFRMSGWVLYLSFPSSLCVDRGVDAQQSWWIECRSRCLPQI